MTDTTEPAATPAPDQQPTGDYATPPELDGLLHAFAKTERSESAISVTVATNGAIITGDVIGRDAWLAKQAAHLDPSGTSRMAEVMNHFSIAETSADHPDFEEYYLHLENGRYLTGGLLVPNAGAGALIRVRLSEVGGWSFGRLSPVGEG